MHFGWNGHPKSNLSSKDIYRNIKNLKEPKTILHSVYLRMEDESKIEINISNIKLR